MISDSKSHESTKRDEDSFLFPDRDPEGGESDHKKGVVKCLPRREEG